MQYVGRMVAAIVWILISFGLSGTCCSAQTGVWITNPSNEHQYKVIDCGFWTDCENMAVTEGAHLVTIRNQQEQNWLTQTFGTSTNYWIGFTDQAQEGTWIWISGEPVTYTDWVPGQPDNAWWCGEHWAVINYFPSSGGWTDLGTCYPDAYSGLAIIEKAGFAKPTLAVDFLSHGLYLRDEKWKKISSHHPNLLAAWGNLLVANFPSLGLFLHNGTSWDRITPLATAESIVGIGGSLYIDSGTGIYRYNGKWSRIHDSSPTMMASYGDKLVAGFADTGLWEYDGSGWKKLSGKSGAEQMVGAGARLFVDFGAKGLYLYDGNWHDICSGDPQQMYAFGTDLVASFNTAERTGLYLYRDSTWRKISKNSLAEGFVSTPSTLYVDCGVSGLYKYENNAWKGISSLNADSIAIYGEKLVADFPTKGLKLYSDTAWTNLSLFLDAGLMQGVVLFE
ncbi:MAG: C-type lectin domain-containing protein [Syntrophobacteraceae bacterium]